MIGDTVQIVHSNHRLYANSARPIYTKFDQHFLMKFPFLPVHARLLKQSVFQGTFCGEKVV